jgi:DNA-binding HxlR family transcriptional regulator
LTDRLKRLQEHGIIERRPYSQAPLRYEYLLTRRGKALRPLLMEIIHWGNTHIEGTVIASRKSL